MQDNHKKTADSSLLETVRIEKLESKGSGFGRLSNGKVVFVPGALPDELVRIRTFHTDGNYQNGKLVEIIEPSSRRISAPCPYFDDCAGCVFQTFAYHDQLEAKRSILLDQLNRIGKLPTAAEVVLPFVVFPSEYEYRSNMTFRILEDGSLALPGKNRRPVQISNCLICRPEINELLAMISFEAESGLTSLEMRVDPESGAQLIFTGAAERPELELETDLPVSIVYSGPAGSAVMAGDSSISQQIGEIEIVAADDSPVFPNPGAINLAAQALQTQLPPLTLSKLLVVPAGTGFWTKWLSTQCYEMIVLDREDSYLDDFLLNLLESENVSLILGELTESISALDRHFDVILYDAVNSSVRKEELQALCEIRPEHLVGIYRDSALFARDCNLLKQAGYDLESCIPVDDLPQTAQFLMIGIFSEKMTGKEIE